jgi:hypothetical protein
LQAQIDLIRTGIEQIQKTIAALPPPAPAAPPVNLIPLQEQIAGLDERIQKMREEFAPQLEGIQKGFGEQLQAIRQSIDQLQLQIPTLDQRLEEQNAKNREQMQKLIAETVGDLRTELNRSVQIIVQQLPADLNQILPRLDAMQRALQANSERFAQTILQRQQQLQQQIAQGGNALVQRVQASEDRLIETIEKRQDELEGLIETLQLQIQAGQQRSEQQIQQNGEQLQKFLQEQFHRLDGQIIPARPQHFHDALLNHILPRLDAHSASLQRIEPRLDAQVQSLQRIEEGQQALRARLNWFSTTAVQRLHALGQWSGLQTGLLLYLLGQVGQLDQRERLDMEQIKQKLEILKALLLALLSQQEDPPEERRANHPPSMQIEVIDDSLEPPEEPSSEESEQSPACSPYFSAFSSVAHLRNAREFPLFRFPRLAQNRDDEDQSPQVAINPFHNYYFPRDFSQHRRPNPQPPSSISFPALPPSTPTPPPRFNPSFPIPRPIGPLGRRPPSLPTSLVSRIPKLPANLTSFARLIPKRFRRLFRFIK